jgi:Flp pilus assembly protein TadD
VCASGIHASISAAQNGDLARAERGLLDAVTRCPDDANGWREFGGLRFVQKRYTDAFLLVDRATALAPGDRDAWQLLGSRTSQNLAAALDAWNRIDRPRVDW